jgi:hypothetical protein
MRLNYQNTTSTDRLDTRSDSTKMIPNSLKIIDHLTMIQWDIGYSTSNKNHRWLKKSHITKLKPETCPSEQVSSIGSLLSLITLLAVMLLERTSSLYFFCRLSYCG